MRLHVLTSTVLALAVGASFACTGGGGGSKAAASSTSTSTSGSGNGTGAGTGTGSGGAGGNGTGSNGSNGASSATSSFDAFAQLRTAIAGLSTADQQTRLDAFIAAQKATPEGFPLRSGLQMAFVVEAPAATPYLAGDFNGWSETSTPLARIGATSVWYVEATASSADRFEYKFVVGGNWTTDALDRKFSYNFGNSVVNIAGSGKSHLEILPAFPSSVLGNTRDVVIYLPAGYLDDAAARYPVCYMHDGNNIFDPTANYGGWHVDSTCDSLISSGQMKKIIVVGAANTPGRMDEYTQVQDDLDPSCNGSQVTGGKAPQYADFMIQELKPVIDAGYRTLTGRDDTAVLGSSLGGLVSVWMAYANPSFARNVGGMSSTFDWGSWCLHNPTAIDDVRAAGKQDFLLYLDTGGSATTSIDNYGPTMDMENLVRSQGFVDGQDLMTYWDQNAPHNEQSWAGRVDRPLLFWFKK